MLPRSPSSTGEAGTRGDTAPPALPDPMPMPWPTVHLISLVWLTVTWETNAHAPMPRHSPCSALPSQGWSKNKAVNLLKLNLARLHKARAPAGEAWAPRC